MKELPVSSVQFTCECGQKHEICSYYEKGEWNYINLGDRKVKTIRTGGELIGRWFICPMVNIKYVLKY